MKDGVQFGHSAPIVAGLDYGIGLGSSSTRRSVFAAVKNNML